MTADPMHDRPIVLAGDELRRQLQTLHGLMLHDQHLAEAASVVGDSHNRDRMSSKSDAHRVDADRIAVLLWGIG